MPKHIERKITGEAKEMIALAFEGMGGLDQLIKTANRSDSMRMTFYTQIYAKLIPVHLNAQSTLDVSVNIKGEEARQKLQSAFLALYEAERDDERAAIEAGRAPLVTYSRVEDPSPIDAGRATVSSECGSIDGRRGTEDTRRGADDTRRGTPVDTSASTVADETKQNPKSRNVQESPGGGPRRVANTYAHPVGAASRELSTTEKFFEWSDNGGLSRSRWDNNQ